MAGEAAPGGAAGNPRGHDNGHKHPGISSGRGCFPSDRVCTERDRGGFGKTIRARATGPTASSAAAEWKAWFEKELKGQDGYRISILDGDGEVKKILANRIVQDGEDIRLTIDAELQTALYEQFREDKGCSVAMNPYTGEVLALVSTPAYDSNDFLLGLSQEQWDALNEDERMPLYNRFRQTWCPDRFLNRLPRR